MSSTNEPRITKLMHLRRGKKGGITKRIDKLKRLLGDSGSRTKIKFLLTALYECVSALTKDCDELFELMDKPDVEWLEEVKASVDEVASDVSEYLSLHQDDNTSSGKSFTDSWVALHAPFAPGDPPSASGGDADVNALAKTLSDTRLRPHPETESIGLPKSHPNVSFHPQAQPHPQETSYSLFSNTYASSPNFAPQQTGGVWGDSSYWKQRLSTKDRRFDPHESVQDARGFQDPSISPFDAAPGGATYGPATSIYGSMPGIPSSVHGAFRPQGTPLAKNEVDSWIDDLDERRCNLPSAENGDLTDNITMAWFVQQTLPRAKIPIFDGAPSGWVAFITKFFTLVHKQVFLTDAQRHMYLLDHLTGEPKTAVKCFSDNWRGYVSALKSLKFSFGQRSLIAQSTLATVIRGKQVLDDNTKSLTDFYYTVRECLVSLKQLNYAADLHSVDTLHQAVQRLPTRMQKKWAEFSRRMRRPGVELNLLHFETWLHERVLDRKESCWPEETKKKPPPPAAGGNTKLVNSAMTGGAGAQKRPFACPLCEGRHYLGKCEKYLLMNDETRFATAFKLKLCLNCFNNNHKSAKCPSKSGCQEEGCGERHHTTLHNAPKFRTPKAADEEPPPPVPEEEREAANNDGGEVLNASTMLKSPQKQVVLLVVPVVLYPPGGGEGVHTFAFLDNGSQGTFLREEMALKLGLRGEPGTLGLKTIKDSENIPVTDVENVVVASQDGSYQRTIEEVVIVAAERFNLPGREQMADPDLYTHLDGINIDPIHPSDVTMLIGGNVPEAVLALEVRHGGKGQPLAVKTVFGWTYYGPSCAANLDPKPPTDVHLIQSSHRPPPPPQVSTFVAGLWKDGPLVDKPPPIAEVTTMERSDQDLHRLVEGMWNQEVLPIAPGGDIAPSREDIKTSGKLENDTILVDGHYQVPMLWKEEGSKLPNNFGMAHKRFNFLRTKLRRDPALYTNYKKTFDSYVAKGYARRLTSSEASRTSDRTWYLPHFPVVNPNKEKIRVVKDAAASYKGEGLNASLSTGPDLLNSLPGVLNRFRVGPYALVADVEEMFHQVRVSEEDADSLRFLWTDDIFSETTYTMQMLVHIFGAKSSPTCANFALQKSARDNLQHHNPQTVEAVLKSFYMDDLLKSVTSAKVATELALDLIALLRRGGFRLTKFASNSQEVLASLPPSEVSKKSLAILSDEHLEQQRALGVVWEISTDIITFTFTIPETTDTKRGILRVTARLYDPLGLVVPFLLTPKLLLRELWRNEYGWDEAITGALLAKWTHWQEMAKHLTEIRVNRCFNLHDSPVTEIQLHVFADASELAYGPVAYLRFSYKDNSHACALVMSKSKLAPLRAIPLPRLELNAAVTAVRLFRNTIFDIDLPVERVVFWSDSTLVLQYINNTTHRFKPFVGNRVSEINECTIPEQWKKVPGPSNPADLVTRGVDDPRSLMEANKNGISWFDLQGHFLTEDEEKWPPTENIPLDESNTEIRRKPVLVALGLVAQPKKEALPDVEPRLIINAERFSSWTKTAGAVGWVRRFIHNARSQPKDRRKGDLSCDELDQAEKLVIRLVQNDVFADEKDTLDRKGVLPSRHKLSPLCPFTDKDGFFRVGGRLRNARIPTAAKNQLILPKDHPITRLLILHEHRKDGHIGREHVLANLREKYWIVNGRVAVKSVLRRCLWCKIKRARQMYPYMADLPQGRLACEEPPFTNCGVDLFGPIYVKQGRKQLKRWGVIFTCLTVRCVHLEPVESLETDDFINCLRRFVNRRGSPKTMYSDRGTNFTGTSTELKIAVKSLDHQKIAKFATSCHFTWKFNPASAPHMGGAWERLVKSSKEVLSSLMNEQQKSLTDQQLHTLLTEVERILNSRPLTHLSDDINDLEPLTPNHILLGQHRQWSFICDIDEDDLTSRKKYRQVQALAMEFWRRWRREFLPKLTTRSKWREHVANVKEGQLVLLADDDVKKSWPLARITKVFPGDDGTVRIVELKTKDGLYTRSVAKVRSLEDD